MYFIYQSIILPSNPTNLIYQW